MKRLVLDCSVSAAWCLREAGSESADRVFELMAGAEVLVPALWLVEMSNVLVMAERRGRITAADVARAEELLGSLPVVVEAARREDLPRVRAVAREYGLTAYDAAYLDLSMRERAPLATLDENLRRAAARAGVELA